MLLYLNRVMKFSLFFDLYDNNVLKMFRQFCGENVKFSRIFVGMLRSLR